MSITTGQSREVFLQEFVDWSIAHIKGDEKGEAQVFLDHLFRAFGQKGSLDVGGIAEMRIRKSSDDGGGTSFADYVWKPVVLIEMKKRGTQLSNHLRQAFDYWVRLVPDRPQYVVLCNFDEFWVYDFNNQLDSPKDKVNLTELSRRWGPLAFLFPTNEPPKFGNDREAVTRAAADKLAECFKKLIIRKVDRNLAQRFILQTLVALFAEDIGLLPRYLFGTLLDECKKPADSYDLIGGLFEAMNVDQVRPGGRYKGVRFFNGGIFHEPAHIELHDDELSQLKAAANSDWAKVSPEIFGAIFQDSMEAEERHAFGAHYTSPVDIMKIVKPTISDPWTEAIEAAKSEKKLNELLSRLARLRVLDPACGSGNFLYLAYREMKRLETRIRDRLATDFPGSQPVLDHVNARQFFGLDINSFAIELAKVSLMIGRKLAIDELHIADEKDLPLDNLDTNFSAVDALLTSLPADSARSAIQTPWPPADVIIGNPPFLGAKRLKPERGAAYVNEVRRLYPEVPGMADYCVYWIRRTHDRLSECTSADPLVGRAGLVGTQNIRNNKSRVGGLDYVVKTGTILEAVDNQPWSGEANVHVSIVNWIKTLDPSLAPRKKHLWSQLTKSATKKTKKMARAADHSTPRYELRYRDVPHINSALSDDTDVSGKLRLDCNLKPKRCFQGKIPGYDGFVIDRSTACQLRQDSELIIYPYLTGREMLDEFKIDRWIIDFGNRDMIDASVFRGAFEHCRKYVLPAVEQAVKDAEAGGSDMVAARQEHLRRWWQLWNRRDELTTVLKVIPRYIGCSRVTRRPVMVFLSSKICPSDLVQVFALPDDYSFGILQSSLHFEWFRKSSRMKVESDTRYSVREVFETFPWPQVPTPSAVHAVAEAGLEVRRVRELAINATGGGLRDLYRTLELPGDHPLRRAHSNLDAAVRIAYGMKQKDDELEYLFRLNQKVAAAISEGGDVQRPGLPSCIEDEAPFLTTDALVA